MLLAPLVHEQRGKHDALLNRLRKEGFVRARVDGAVTLLEELAALAPRKKHTIDAVVDRLIVKPGIEQRLADSTETDRSAFRRARHRVARARRRMARRRLQHPARLPGSRRGEHRFVVTATVQLQLAAGRLRNVPWAGHDDGIRHRADRPRPERVARRGRDCGVATAGSQPLRCLCRHDPAVLRAIRRLAGYTVPQHSGGEVADPLARHERSRCQLSIRRGVRGDSAEPAPPLEDDRVGCGQTAAARVHGRVTLRRVRRCETRSAGRCACASPTRASPTSPA